MLINEVCKKCKLTKKAIEYYEEQRLIQPQVLENGYRDFSDSEIEQLKKIAVLRKLGLSVSDIQTVLNGKNKTALYNVSNKKALELETIKAKQELAQKLAQSQDWEYTRLQLEAIEQKQTISERLLNVFPGYYGKYVSLHFGLYLNEPIITKEQQEAFDTVISFLDSADLKIPVDLQEYLDEATKISIQILLQMFLTIWVKWSKIQKSILQIIKKCWSSIWSSSKSGACEKISVNLTIQRSSMIKY